MDIDELRSIFGCSRRAIRKYVEDGIIDPPTPPGCRWSRYAPDSVERIRAYHALKHNNTVLRDIPDILRDEGITIQEYVRRRESAIRAHGLGVA